MGAQQARPLRANIVSWQSGGLGVDVDLVADALARAGCLVYIKGRRRGPVRGRVESLLRTAVAVAGVRWATWTGRPQFDLNVFVESIFPEFLPAAAVNCLLVNAEWFRGETEALVPTIDYLLCKTPGVMAAFTDQPVALRNVHFTSPDRRLALERVGPLRCLHIAGQSALKGTEAVVGAWARHPEWPPLTVVRRSRRYGGEEAPALPAVANVRYETERVPDDLLRRWQNECQVHVQPSQAEGYGHVIGEAMSCGAVVVTTDAAPMNELVAADRGCLVRVRHTEPMRRATKNFVDDDDLEATLTTVFAMSSEGRALIGRRARAWFEAQDQRFNASFSALLAELHPPRPDSQP